ncbi:MAG: CtsR family transcriptional regulator [Ruminococcaceae bacterium]|nr:CtsR family transcriptional regulator [Oscillospiraceae bacterium]
MPISDSIAKIIEQKLEEGGGTTEVRRSDLAARLGCVPSQVTYVITSRFTPERGYITESRRGGGGYIRINRVTMDKSEYLMHFFHAVGDSLDEREAVAFLRNLRDNGVIDEKGAAIAAAALSERALARVEPRGRSAVRADIMRHILLGLLR